MIESFRHRGLKRLYERGDGSKVRAGQLSRISDVLFHLDRAQAPGARFAGLSPPPAQGRPERLLERDDFRQLAHHLPLRGRRCIRG